MGAVHWSLVFISLLWEGAAMNRAYVAVFSMVLLSGLRARAEAPAPLTEFLQAAPLPPGYRATTTESDLGNITGTSTEVTKPNRSSKVVIMTAIKGVNTLQNRRDVVRGFVESAIGVNAKEGFRVSAEVIPDWDNEKFDDRAKMAVVLANANGSKVWNYGEAFFTEKAFIVWVVGLDKTEFDRLRK
jgi:hypothetical protein